MSVAPAFASTPHSEIIAISTANTLRTGAGAIVAGFTPGASGSLLDRIEIKAQDATTAGMVRAFKKKGAGSWELWREYPVTAVASPGATTPTFSTLESGIGEVLPADVVVGFSTHNAEAFEVHCSGGDF